MIVVDAGAFIEVLLDSPGGRTVRASMASAGAAAPDLFDAEVFHRLLVLEEHGYFTSQQVQARIDRLNKAPLERLAHQWLLHAAHRFGAALPGYDALYVAAASRLGAMLFTTDARLIRTATEQFGVPVATVPTSGR